MGGFSSITADPLGTVLNADNVSFDGSTRGGVITTDGELLIGSTVAPHIRVGEITSPLGTLNIGYSSPNITLDLSGSGLAIDSVGVQTGTSPISPTGAGLITINGAVVAAGTNPVRTDGTGANTMAVEVQISQAIAAPDATKIGLANFDSADFTVDANGFVGLTASAFTEGSVIFMGPTALSEDNANFFWDDTENRLGIGTNTPLETVHIEGNMLIDHTAAENDDHALEIICDAAGFSDVKALDIDFITGAVAAGEQDEVILINIDETAAVGGQIVAIQVVSTTEGIDAVIALKCGPGIDAIRQEVGTFGDMDSADNDGANVLAALIAGGPGNISVFVADDDTLTIGNATSFAALEILVATPASGSGIAPTFRYSTGIAAWSPFGPEDGTNGFKNTGVIEWDVNDLAGFAPGAGAEYLIEIKRTRNVLATTPIIDEVQISALTEFKWDKDANANLNSLTLVTPLVVSSGGTGAASLTDHGIMLGSGTGAVTVTAAPTNGQLLIGSTGVDPVLGSLTSTGGSVTITPGAGTINLEVAAGNDAILTLTGNSGGALSPTAGNINTLGTGSITIAGAGSTLTTQLTGLTANSVLYGLGTATVGLVASGTTGQVLQTNTGAAPTYSTATYPSTTTISQILYSSANNVVSGLSTANSATLVTTSTGVPVMTSSMTDGQVVIGSTGATPVAATLTAGTGVSITNAAGSITINATGGGIGWSVITIDQTAVINNGYICNKAGLLTLTLPASAAIGDIIQVTGINTALGWKIAQNANQRIHFGTSSTTLGVGGSLASVNIRDSVELVCVVAGASTEYNVISSVGNITVV